MEHSFWTARWKERRIGFHRSSPSPLLTGWIDRLVEPEEGAKSVLVPLAGKSLDIEWLRSRGHSVVAVEFVEQAVREFFSDQGIEPSQSGDLWTAERLKYFARDFFEVRAEELGVIDAIYDRAALTALPQHNEALRRRYTKHLLNLLKPGGRILLVSLEYDPQEMNGPPFGTTVDEISSFFAGTEIELLSEADVLEEEAHFKERGLTRLVQRAHLISTPT